MGKKIDLSKVVDNCRHKLPSPLFYPSYFLILEDLPKTVSGKIQNFKLRKLLNSGKTPVLAFENGSN
jgi:acyl-coenzyme A synthetase/AMP-(fatty) acid ligase